MPLTDARVRFLKPALTVTKHSDGGELHLLITPQGSKLWRLAYRFAGKQKTLALGVCPVVSLSDARQKGDGAKRLLASAVDPSVQAKLDKISKRESSVNTFNAVANEFLEKIEREGKAAVTVAKKRWLIDSVRPDLGISVTDQSRLRATIGQVFRYGWRIRVLS